MEPRPLPDKIKICLIVAITACQFALLMGFSCVFEEDDSGPGVIQDVNFFSQYDALDWNGARVTVGDTSGEINTRILAWTAKGDDGTSGRAAAYDIRYIKGQDLVDWGWTGEVKDAFLTRWKDAHKLVGEPYPSDAGSLEQSFLPRLVPGDSIWLAMRAIDDVTHESPLSNVVGPVQSYILHVTIYPNDGDTAGSPGFGTRVSATGDMNGDDEYDMLVADPVAGVARIMRGEKPEDLIKKMENPNGLKVMRVIPRLRTLSTITGDPAEEFASSAAGVYLVNYGGDNVVAVGAPGHDVGAAANAGAVYLYYGGEDVDPAYATADADLVIEGDSAGDRFGASICPAFNLEKAGDARYHFMVGAPGKGGGGAVYVFKGDRMATRPDAIILAENAGDSLGFTLASLGDVSGDGINDVAVGAPGFNGGAGAVYIFFGGLEGAIDWEEAMLNGPVILDLAAEDADVVIRGTEPGARFGKSIVAASKLEGADTEDLDNDIAIAGGETVYVFFGNSVIFPPDAEPGLVRTDADAGAVISAVNAGAGFGTAIMGPGDLNSDAIDDLVVCAPGEGTCYFYYGPVLDGMTPARSITSDEPGDGFGSSIAGMADYNGDGYADLLIGAPAAGKAYFEF